MNRSYWSGIGSFLPGEKSVSQVGGVRLYDGEDRTDFESGVLQLTTHRLLWDDEEQEGRSLAFDLKLVDKLDTVQSGFRRSAKIKVYLLQAPASQTGGPSNVNKHNFVQLSFRKGGQEEFNIQLKEQLKSKLWEKTPDDVTGGLKLRKGIVGIERHIEKKQRESDRQVSGAFKDLDALIDKAKEMVNVVNKFAAKIEEKKGNVSDDETAQFRSYMLSVGISNPVTRDSNVSNSEYHRKLSRELADFLQVPLIDSGGMISVTDVYCMYNRARGLELVSPDDVVSACQLFQSLDLPMRLRVFDSGVLVVQSLVHNEANVIEETSKLITENSSLTAQELSNLVGVAIMLATERLLLTEAAGKACRDDSVEGLRFYPNKFIDQ